MTQLTINSAALTRYPATLCEGTADGTLDEWTNWFEQGFQHIMGPDGIKERIEQLMQEVLQASPSEIPPCTSMRELFHRESPAHGILPVKTKEGAGAVRNDTKLKQWRRVWRGSQEKVGSLWTELFSNSVVKGLNHCVRPLFDDIVSGGRLAQLVQVIDEPELRCAYGSGWADFDPVCGFPRCSDTSQRVAKAYQERKEQVEELKLAAIRVLEHSGNDVDDVKERREAMSELVAKRDELLSSVPSQDDAASRLEQLLEQVPALHDEVAMVNVLAAAAEGLETPEGS